MHETAAELREVIERGEAIEAEALVAKLDGQLSALAEAIREAITAAPPVGGEGADDVDGADLAELRALIDDSDTEALDWLGARRGALEQAWGVEAVSDLAKALDVFDFERAAKIMRESGEGLDRVG